MGSMSRRISRRAIFLGLGGAVATFVAGLLGMAGDVPSDEVVSELWYPLFLAGLVFVIVVGIYWFDSTAS